MWVSGLGAEILTCVCGWCSRFACFLAERNGAGGRAIQRPRPYETGRATQACFVFSWVERLSREGTRTEQIAMPCYKCYCCADLRWARAAVVNFLSTSMAEMAARMSGHSWDNF